MILVVYLPLTASATACDHRHHGVRSKGCVRSGSEGGVGGGLIAYSAASRPGDPIIILTVLATAVITIT